MKKIMKVVHICLMMFLLCAVSEETSGSNEIPTTATTTTSKQTTTTKQATTAKQTTSSNATNRSINNRHEQNGNPTPHHPKTKQRKIVISTVLEEPYVMLRQSGMFMTGNDRFQGYLVDLLNRIFSNIGCQHEIRLSRNGRYGEFMDGAWDGSIGEVLMGTADVAAGPLAVDERKHHYVDFSEPFLTLRSSALIKRPHGRNKTSDHVPTTVDELLSNMEYTVGVLRESSAQRSLSTSTNPAYRTAWARATSSWPSGIVDSIQEGIERARRERFAFIVDSPTSEYVAGRKPCDLIATEPFLESIKYALVLRKGDRSLRQSLDRSLRQMRDNSELQSLYLRWWKDECKRFHASTAVKRSNSSSPDQRTPPQLLAFHQSTPTLEYTNASPSLVQRFRLMHLLLPPILVSFTL